MRRWGAMLGVACTVLLVAGLGWSAAAQSSVGVGVSVRAPHILGVYLDTEPMPGMLIQGNVGLNPAQQYDIQGFGIKASYEFIPAVAAVVGYSHYGPSHVISAGARYMERMLSLSAYAGVQYQYMLDAKRGNFGLEAGGKLGIWQNYFLGVEGGYHLMEDGTPNLAVYVGCEF